MNLIQQAKKIAGGSARSANLLFAFGVVAFALMMFRVVFLSPNVLFTTDDGIGAIQLLKSAMPWSFLGYWDDSVLAGVAGLLGVGWTTVLQWLLPVKFFVNWIHGIDLALASVFFALFLRSRKISWPACALGALTAFWLGSNFTLTYAGHIRKFGILALAGFYLWTVEQAARSRRWGWAVLAGGGIGLMFMEQPDVALFFALLLGPYALFAVIRERGFDVRALLGFVIPAGVAAALLFFNQFWMARSLNLGGIKSTDRDAQSQWEYATQWSWPPEESIDFVAPGFTGWRSGEPEGPYCGRMGRSAGWEQTRQGFQNFKLENQYLGAIPVICAVFAVFAAWRGWRSRTAWHLEAAFWAAVTLIALLLSFGKHFFLYRLFYALPMVSSIRNPNKFLQVFQVTLAVLSAYGLEAALAGTAERGSMAVRRFVLGAAAVAGVLGLWTLGSVASWGNQASSLSEWGVLADTIVRNRCWALGHAAVMALAGALLLWALLLRARNASARPATVSAWAAVALVAADALLLARHYVMPLPPSLIQGNEAVEMLKANRGHQRVAMVTQQGFYNTWLTFLFPYYGIPTLNATQMPQMTDDYKQFFSTLANQPLRLWELAAAKFIMGPAQLWGQVQNDARLKDVFDLVYAYNVFQDPEGGAEFSRATQGSPGQHVILKIKGDVPRYTLVSGWTVVSDEEALRMLASPGFAPFSQVLLAPDTPAPQRESAASGPAGSATVKRYRSGHVRLQVSADRPAILRISEKYHPNWKAAVDGKPVPVLRCDYLFQGVYVEPGLHEVVVTYAPSRVPFLVQVCGLALCLAAIANLALRRPKAEA
ncbi:MAG: hypothetical protein V1873_08035 [Verrucomicrobiota bacterium]